MNRITQKHQAQETLLSLVWQVSYAMEKSENKALLMTDALGESAHNDDANATAFYYNDGEID